MRSAAELYAAHQRARFTRPDAALWIRPDAARWVRPDIARFLLPGTDPADVFPELDRKYNPNQPRVPAGNPDGGQWTDGGGGAIVPASDLASNQITDFSAQSRGGHHEMPKGVFEKWDLPPETRKVFNGSTTGKIPDASLRYELQGPAYRHVWGDENGLHPQYNKAVQELSNSFLEKNDIKPETMTPQQARELLREIDISEDPRIRDFNRAMRLIRLLIRLRTGRE